MDELEVVEVVPGEYEAVAPHGRCRVLVPAGVGVPGVADEDVAAAAVTYLWRRDGRVPEVVDLSALLATDAGLLEALEVLDTDE